MPIRVQSLRSSVKLQRPTAGARDPGELYTNYPDKQFGVIDAAKNPMDLLAIRFFSTATDYVGGDFVVNGGTGYKAKGPITAGAFNPAQWDTLATSIDLGGKEDTIAAGTTAQYWRGDKTWQTLDKVAVGLANVDNTSDMAKPVSTAAAAAINIKANIDSQTLTGIPRAPTAALGNYTTQLATTQFVGTEIGTALVGKANTDSPAFSGNPTAPTPSPGDNDTSIATTAFVTSAVIAANAGQITDAPSNGQSYGRKDAAWVDVTEEAPSDLLTYGRKNGAWATVVGGAHTDDSPPPGPLVDGQLWWKSDSGDTFVYYVDASGPPGTWVQINTPADLPLPTAEERNLVVNPAVQISQQQGFEISCTNNEFPADQWGFYTVTGGVPISMARTVEVPDNYLYINSMATLDTAIAAADYVMFQQRLEGLRTGDLNWGTASAKPAVLRFEAKCGGGVSSFVMGVSLRNAANDRSIAHNVTLNTGWQTFVIPIPACMDGVWPDAADSSFAVALAFAGMAGSNYLTANAGVWETGTGRLGLTGIGNCQAVASTLLYIRNIGLYRDPDGTGLAPPFRKPDWAEEMAACQRYWQSLYNVGSAYMVAASNNLYAHTSFMAAMRGGATASGVSSNNANMPAAVGTLAITQSGVRENRLSTAAGNCFYTTTISVNARM